MICFACRTNSASSEETVEHIRVRCLRCGEYTVLKSDGDALKDPSRWGNLHWKISAWVRDFRPDVVKPEHFDLATRAQIPSLMYRAQRVLRTMAGGVNLGGKIALRHRSPIPGAEHYKKLKQTNLTEIFKTCISVGWCSAERELDYLLESVLVGDLKWLRMDVDVCQITPKGYLELESKDSVVSKNGFCAMWFDDSMLPFYVHVIEKAIRASGYEPVRLDHKEHNNNIDDEIIASIRSAKFVIAEMTGHRGGVYFEAGFAHGLGLPVIYMVQEDDKDNVHFDVQSQNFILWSPDDLPDARKRLENRILATLGRGPLDPARY